MERTWKADYEKFARTARENVAATLDNMDYPALERAAELILAAKAEGKRLHISGIGKPAHLAGYAASLFSSTGTPAYFLHGTEAVHGSCGQLVPGDVVIFISNSGETAEMKATVSAVKNNGCAVIGVSGNASSWLAQQSEVHLLAHADAEGGPLDRAPRASILAETLVLQALSVLLQSEAKVTPQQYVKWHPGGSLGRRLLMTVGNVMRSHDLPVVAPDCSATDMIHAISKGGLGLIIICDGDRIEGIVTDGDVRRAMERRRAEFFNIKAADIATPNPKTISADRKLIEAEKMMTRNKVTSLLVTDEAGKLQGVIQIYDIKL